MVNATASIHSGAAYGLLGLRQATDDITLATARLSTGNRFVRAGDDVSSLSIATRLQSDVTSLRQALVNTSQASSLLQVAYDGLSSITDVLDRMYAIAVQANSATLTAGDRSFLNQEFQELSEEVDRLATTTSFGGVNLLDGSISREDEVLGITTESPRATGILAFTANIAAGQTVRLNGAVFTEGTDFAAGGTTDLSVAALAVALNNSTDTRISGATYTAVGATLEIEYDSGGEVGNQYIINQATSTAAFTTSGGSTVTANVYTLTGGTNTELSGNSVTVGGTIGDSIITTQSQTHTSTTLTFTGNAVDNEELRIDDGNGGTINFRFKNTTATALDIQIGADIEETLQNAMALMSQYSATTDYGLRQLEFIRDGDSLTIRGAAAGATNDLVAAALNVTETLTNATISTGTLNGAVQTGVTTNGVSNPDFYGEIQGFAATYNSADDVTMTITVGDSTYTGEINDTTPAADTTIRFHSTDGGFFDIELDGGSGLAVTNQTTADAYAARINAAFEGLTFYQNRVVDNFTAAGAFAGASMEFARDDFENVFVEDITVSAPPSAGQSATIEMTINGETFRNTTDIGSGLGQYEIVRLTSLDDGNRVITLRNGSAAQDLSTSTLADTFADNLRDALGLGTGDGSISFQIGSSSTNTLEVSITSARTEKLFDGQTLDVGSQSTAAIAETALEDALAEVERITTTVGSLQERTDYAAAALSSEITEKDLARASLADTDVSVEATNLALATVLAQTSIAVIAQTNNLSSSLLTLVQNNN